MAILDMGNTSMKHKILINEKVSDEAIDFLKKNNIDIKNGVGFNDQEIIEELKDCDGVLVRRIKINKNIIDNCPNLKLIAKHGTGLDGIDVEYAKSKNIEIIHTAGLNANSVAEHTMSLILACAKQLRVLNNEYEKGDFSIKDKANIIELKGKTLGLIGYGNIARIVSSIAHFGFNMKVIVYDPYINIDVQKYINMVNDINYLLSNSDFISIHIPGGANNNNLINKEKLIKMKSSAYIINTSRGNIVNEDDLIWAIENKKIAGAGLDVCANEPEKSNSKLFLLKNILLTPHVGGSSKEAMENIGLDIAKQIVDKLND